ncbi:amidase signature domain-containing protein [Paraphoma chrysanthemicola]|uniref:Amidase signature domain-containing protein n=1 Tax=Paraphoma chrysanthemicola TaxID=798071 RepID=A0A8K0RDM5_9PLEO|nr:amidase signature domain-containing protein [Paraphoma chrysanthemicola]
MAVDALSENSSKQHEAAIFTSDQEFAIGSSRFVTRNTDYPGRWFPKALVTVINVSARDTIDTTYLKRRIQQYLTTCDVFRIEFLQCIEFQGASQDEIDLGEDAAKQLRIWGNMWTKFVSLPPGGSTPPPGPYVAGTDFLRQVWRVFDDDAKAFLVSTWPSASDPVYGYPPSKEPRSHENNHLAGQSFGTLGVAVPSRLYFCRTENRPLDGIRIAIKDVYHLNGLRTSVCNRAYHDLYPPRTETAHCIETLISLGAIVVGKTHLSSFAWREEPTECVDYPAPFNPRGDGYQSPAGSSSGSGAAIAAYEWLDITLGTDTTGSGRRPALWNGCFAIRPSTNILSCEGMVPTCPKFDVPSFFGRDINPFKHFAQSWYGGFIANQAEGRNHPWQIIYPTDYLPTENLDQMRGLDYFVGELATFLSVEPRKLSISQEWKDSAPIQENSLPTYMQNVQAHGFFYDLYHCFDQFRDDYWEKHRHEPFLTKTLRWAWGIGGLVSKEQRDDAMDRVSVFRDWFIKHIMQPEQKRTIVILPIETLEPRYRDTAPDLPYEPPKGLSVLYFSPALGAPEIVVPAGQIPYKSRITGQEEFLPVAVSLLGAPGTDMELISLVERFLISAGRPTKVLTGKNMFGEGPSQALSIRCD